MSNNRSRAILTEIVRPVVVLFAVIVLLCCAVAAIAWTCAFEDWSK